MPTEQLLAEIATLKARVLELVSKLRELVASAEESGSWYRVTFSDVAKRHIQAVEDARILLTPEPAPALPRPFDGSTPQTTTAGGKNPPPPVTGETT